MEQVPKWVPRLGVVLIAIPLLVFASLFLYPIDHAWSIEGQLDIAPTEIGTVRFTLDRVSQEIGYKVETIGGSGFAIHIFDDAEWLAFQNGTFNPFVGLSQWEDSAQGSPYPGAGNHRLGIRADSAGDGTSVAYSIRSGGYRDLPGPIEDWFLEIGFIGLLMLITGFAFYATWIVSMLRSRDPDNRAKGP